VTNKTKKTGLSANSAMTLDMIKSSLIY